MATNQGTKTFKHQWYKSKNVSDDYEILSKLTSNIILLTDAENKCFWLLNWQLTRFFVPDRYR